MSLSDDDLENLVEKMRDTFYKHNEHKGAEVEMYLLLESLSDELESSRQNEKCLSNNLMQLLECENADITSKYVALKDKRDEVEKENVELKNQMEDLRMQMVVDLQLQEAEWLRKMAESDKKYTELLKQSESDKMYYQSKEQELLNQIELAKASTALQCDEIESDLKRQLVDANCKLRNSQNLARSLQVEINSLKNQMARQQIQTQPKPSKPEIRFSPLPVVTNRLVSTTSDHFECEDSDCFEVLPVRVSTPLNKKPTPQFNTPTVYRGTGVTPKRLSSAEIETAPKSKVKRKRKLYDPDSFDLSNMPTI